MRPCDDMVLHFAYFVSNQTQDSFSNSYINNISNIILLNMKNKRFSLCLTWHR